MLEIRRSRGKRVTWIIAPDIAFAIAGEILGILLERRGHELRVTHRTSPTALHPRGRGIARLQDPQRVQQFPFKKGPPPPVIGQCRERAEHRIAAPEGAIGTFQSPDRGDDLFLDAIARFDLG